MTLIEIVGTEPQPWWPEGVVHVEGGGWRYTGHDWTRTLFIGACVEFLMRGELSSTDSSRPPPNKLIGIGRRMKDGKFEYAAFPRPEEGIRDPHPDLLSALVAACRAAQK